MKKEQKKVKKRISLYPKDEEYKKPQYFEKAEKPLQKKKKLGR